MGCSIDLNSRYTSFFFQLFIFLSVIITPEDYLRVKSSVVLKKENHYSVVKEQG
jgi:hypothetical protein